MNEIARNMLVHQTVGFLEKLEKQKTVQTGQGEYYKKLTELQEIQETLQKKNLTPRISTFDTLSSDGKQQVLQKRAKQLELEIQELKQTVLEPPAVFQDGEEEKQRKKILQAWKDQFYRTGPSMEVQRDDPQAIRAISWLYSQGFVFSITVNRAPPAPRCFLVHKVVAIAGMMALVFLVTKKKVR